MAPASKERFRRRAEGDITPGGLLLAANMRVRTNPAGGGGPLFFGLRLGAEQLLGVRGTWEAVRERLSRYSLAQVLDILGRVSAVLAQGQSSRDIQHRLLLGLFDDAQGRVQINAKSDTGNFMKVVNKDGREQVLKP